MTFTPHFQAGAPRGLCWLVRNAEAAVAGGVGQVGGLGVADVAGEGGLDVPEAGVDLFAGALDEHLDGAVGAVADEAGDIVAAGDAVRGVAKAHALDVAAENDVFGYPIHDAPRFRVDESILVTMLWPILDV